MTTQRNVLRDINMFSNEIHSIWNDNIKTALKKELENVSTTVNTREEYITSVVKITELKKTLSEKKKKIEEATKNFYYLIVDFKTPQTGYFQNFLINQVSQKNTSYLVAGILGKITLPDIKISVIEALKKSRSAYKEIKKFETDEITKKETLLSRSQIRRKYTDAKQTVKKTAITVGSAIGQGATAAKQTAITVGSAIGQGATAIGGGVSAVGEAIGHGATATSKKFTTVKNIFGTASVQTSQQKQKQVGELYSVPFSPYYLEWGGNTGKFPLFSYDKTLTDQINAQNYITALRNAKILQRERNNLKKQVQATFPKWKNKYPQLSQRLNIQKQKQTLLKLLQEKTDRQKKVQQYEKKQKILKATPQNISKYGTLKQASDKYQQIKEQLFSSPDKESASHYQLLRQKYALQKLLGVLETQKDFQIAKSKAKPPQAPIQPPQAPIQPPQAPSKPPQPQPLSQSATSATPPQAPIQPPQAPIQPSKPPQPLSQSATSQSATSATPLLQPAQSGIQQEKHKVTAQIQTKILKCKHDLQSTKEKHENDTNFIIKISQLKQTLQKVQAKALQKVKAATTKQDLHKQLEQLNNSIMKISQTKKSLQGVQTKALQQVGSATTKKDIYKRVEQRNNSRHGVNNRA